MYKIFSPKHCVPSGSDLTSSLTPPLARVGASKPAAPDSALSEAVMRALIAAACLALAMASASPNDTDDDADAADDDDAAAEGMEVAEADEGAA